MVFGDRFDGLPIDEAGGFKGRYRVGRLFGLLRIEQAQQVILSHCILPRARTKKKKEKKKNSGKHALGKD
jgi:hypothetical protein